MYIYPQPVQYSRPRRLGRLQTSAIAPRRRRRLSGLGQAALLSPQQFCGSKCNTAFVNELQNAIQNRLLQWPPLPANANCTGAPASSGAAKVTQTGSIAAGTIAGTTQALVSSGLI